MAAQILFKIACPSCEAQIPVRDANLVGRKVACPTCKYQFVVENPDGFEPLDGSDAGAGDSTKKKAKKKSGGGNALKIGMAAGGVAVAVLGAGVYFLFLKGDEPKPKPSTPPAAMKTVPPAATPAANVAANSAPAENKPNETKPAVGGSEPAATTPAAPAVASAPPANPVPTAGSSGDITNLLPNDCVAVTLIDIEKYRFTTMGEQLFEGKVGFPSGAFKTRLGIDVGDMEKFVRGENVEQKWTFNVLRTKKPVDFANLEKVLGLKKGAKSPIQGRAYYEVAPNPLIDNLSTAFLSPNEVRERKAKKAEEMAIGLLPIDESTLIFAQLEPLEDFMKTGCSPRKQSKSSKTPNDPASPATPAGGDAPPKRGGRDMSTAFSANMASMTMLEDDAQLTENATFLTVDPPIKAMFDRLHADAKNPAIITHVILPQSDPRLYARLRSTFGLPDARTFPGMKVVGLMVTQYQLEKFYATVGVEFFNENDVKGLEAGLKKALPNVAQFIGGYLGIKVEVDGDSGGGGGGGGGGGKGGGGGRGGGGGGSGESAGGGISGGLPGISNIEEGPASKLRVVRKGRYLFGTFELNLVQRAYDRLYSISETLVAKIRGNVDMANPLPSWKEFSAAALKLRENEIPRGTYPRDEGTGGRLARSWPPQARVSWMAGLLPHLGHEDLFKSIELKKNWREDRNLKAGATIVPEFLDPRYPDRSWYAKLDSLGSHDQAATHFVGIAGVGLDAGDYKADDKAFEKKIGAFNYDRATKIRDVTDGVSNTIYIIQVPPTYQRPWIAGGGATIAGVPETRSIRPFVYNHSGKKGTYVVMLDGSVRFISEDISDEVFKALCTIKGGETTPPIDEIAPKAKAGGPELKTTPKDD